MNRGLSLVEAIVGIALMLVIFLGLFGVFKMAISIVDVSRARIGALALANEQIERIRNLPYGEIGIVGGIPAGTIQSSENVELNGINYTRDTFIQYIDSVVDGEGENDENGITADFKRIRVEVSWQGKNTVSPVVFVSDAMPLGIETTAGGGTLKIKVFNAAALPVTAAGVHIENSGVIPVVSFDTFTNSEGAVVFPGSPAAENYEIAVSKNGYNSSQTYGVTAENPTPQPEHLTIIQGQTTEAGFAIDLLASKTVKTYKPSDIYVWSDSFFDETKVSATSSVTISGGKAELASTTDFGYENSGYLISGTIQPEELIGWQEFSWNDEENASSTVKYQLLYPVGQDWILIPEPDLAGNADGFGSSPLDISGLATTTYSSLRLKANLSTIDASTTPSLLDWQTKWISGRLPFASIPFHVRGDKIIGKDIEGDPIYKYSENLTTNQNGEIAIENLEWDNYSIAVDGAAFGYDISESCPFQPANISPGTGNTTQLVLLPHTANSLLVAVSDASGAFLPGVSIRLYKTGYDETKISSSGCGQAFFSGVAASSSYILEASKAGYENFTLEGVSVSGYKTLEISLSYE